MLKNTAAIKRMVNKNGERPTFEYNGSTYTTLVACGRKIKAKLGETYFRFPIKWFHINPETNQLVVEMPTIT